MTLQVIFLFKDPAYFQELFRIEFKWVLARATLLLRKY